MSNSSRCLLAACAAFSLPPAITAASAAPLKTLHRFINVAKGARPRAGLISDAAGNLYGTTYTGAPDGNGTVFELSPPVAGSKKWVQTVLHRFSANVKDGIFPWAGVALDSAGNLYGTTSEGGINDAGVAYELQRPAGGTGKWQYTVLHRFTAGRDGGTPDGTLIFGPDGALYSTAAYGGTKGAGVVYRLAPNGSGGWTHDILYNFSNGADGGYPFSTLIFDGAGNIYGTALNGGNTGNGVVFELSPGGSSYTETTLHSFDSATDGVEPRTGVILDAAGNLYGTTESGGSIGYGAVFEVSPPAKAGRPWTEAVLHNFGFSPDGGSPGYSTLVLDKSGSLYGTTQTGGTMKNGVVFKIAPPAQPKGTWTETAIHTFRGAPDGSQPESGLLPLADGSLIGTTLFGGTVNNDGLIFAVAP
jgi:uncharacterized repeat protein (TIGR03803 family)